MTAIVGTINRRGVAFAADSAATHTATSKHKITNHANKIFELSKEHPVGISICGNLDFLGLPWEEIFKLFRKQIGIKPFDTLVEYSSEFWNFIREAIMPILEETRKNQLEHVFRCFLDEILGLAKNVLNESGVDINSITMFDAITNQLDHFDSLYSTYVKSPEFSTYTFEDFFSYSEDIIERVFSDILSQPECPSDFIHKISHTIFTIITSNIHVYLSNTELIFWGYGDKELFPSYYSFVISSAFDNKIKWTPKSEYQVSNINVACIEPFAQTDVANTVVRGIDDDLRQRFYEGYGKSIDVFKNEIISKLEEVNAPTELIDVLAKIDTQKYLESYIQGMNDYIDKNYIQKLVNTISYLSKEDLADMAESLVRMTYLKRRITSEEESVGGPVDVAVITKGDGFVWIKRKHYFPAEINHRYFTRNS